MPDRQRIRLASWLHQLWQKQASAFPELPYEWSLLLSRWEGIQQSFRRCQLALQHRLLLCLPELQRELGSALRNEADLISSLRSAYEPVVQEDLTFRHWHEEVQQLYEEFNTVTFEKNEGKLRVETPVITLGKICLGAFAIDFKKGRHGLSIQSFEIVALNPEPACTDSEVTHPHVKDGELCAGDAKVPIRAALEAGRLTDAF